MLSSVFDAFVQKSPISVMARGLMERAQRLMPNLTAGIIPNAGHTLNMEQPESSTRVFWNS